MHEYSLVRALLKQAEALQEEQANAKVSIIRVSVGEFSGVEPELFREAFATLVEESPLRGAQLQMEHVELRSACNECGHEFHVERFRFECPRCKSGNVAVISGEGLVLESVTMESVATELADTEPVPRADKH